MVLSLTGRLVFVRADWPPSRQRKRESLLVNGELYSILEPGPVVGHVTGDGATHQLKFTVPSQDGPVEFLDLLEDAHPLTSRRLCRLRSRRRVRLVLPLSPLRSPLRLWGSAERVLEAEAASEASRVASEAARDAAESSASASAASASDSAAARDAAELAQAGSELAQAGAESARDDAVVAQGASELAGGWRGGRAVRRGVRS